MENKKISKKSVVKKGSKVGGIIGAVAGVAALSAAAYVLFGPDAKKNRKMIKGWAVKMKGEMIEKLEEAKEITEPIYNKIVDDVSSKYLKAKNVDQKELQALVADVKKHWKAMSKDLQSKSKKSVKVKSKIVK